MANDDKTIPYKAEEEEDPSIIARQEDLSLFSAPWCQALFTRPDFIRVYWPDRRPPPPLYDHCSNSMFAETLWTDRTLRACIQFTLSLPENPYYPYEYCQLFALGDGLDGMTGRGHGGLTSLLMDQCMGICATRAHLAASTANLYIDFKNPVGTPCLVLIRARVEKIEGKRCWGSGVMEDGMGKVYAEGKGLFVRGKQTDRIHGKL